MNNNIPLLDFCQIKNVDSFQSAKTYFATSFVEEKQWDSGMSAHDMAVYLKEQLTRSQFKIFGYIYRFSQTAEKLFPSHEFIAVATRTSVSTVKRALSKLKDLGVLTKAWRQFQSNRYWINARYLTSELKSIFKSWLINIGIMSFSLSMLLPKHAVAENELLLIYKEESYLTINQLLLVVPNSAREVDGSGLVYFHKEKGRMYQESLTMLSEQSDPLPLTQKGLLKLAVFPPSVIKELLTVPFRTDVQDIFAYLFGIGKNIANRLEEVLDFTTFDQVIKELKIVYQPYIEASALEEYKKTHQPVVQKKFGKNLNHREQQAAASTSQAAKWKADEEKQESLKNDRIRTMGLDPDKLSYYQRNNLLKGNLTSEQVQKELTETVILEYPSNKQPTTPQEFIQARKEVVFFFETKKLLGMKLNQFEQQVLDGFKDPSLDVPANPLDTNSPSVRSVISSLSP